MPCCSSLWTARAASARRSSPQSLTGRYRPTCPRYSPTPHRPADTMPSDNRHAGTVHSLDGLLTRPAAVSWARRQLGPIRARPSSDELDRTLTAYMCNDGRLGPTAARARPRDHRHPQAARTHRGAPRAVPAPLPRCALRPVAGATCRNAHGRCVNDAPLGRGAEGDRAVPAEGWPYPGRRQRPPPCETAAHRHPALASPIESR